MKNLMIFMVLLQISYAVNISNPSCDQYNEILDWAQWPHSDCQELPRCLNLSSSFETCNNCGGKMIGHDNLMMICIPSFFKQTLSHPPYPQFDLRGSCTKVAPLELKISLITHVIQNIENCHTIPPYIWLAKYYS